MTTFNRITYKSIFGDPVTGEAEILGDVRKGYDLEGGGWTSLPGPHRTPAHFWFIRWKGKRHYVMVNRKNVLRIE